MRFMKTVLTYGTFDLLHYGHVEILRRAHELTEGGRLIVAVSTDEFNQIKGKTSHMPYEKRKQLVESIRYVDMVIPEEKWEQKPDDIKNHNIDLVVMGSDWEGRPEFENLKDLCAVTYLPRTKGISSSTIKKILDLLKQLEAETL